MAFVTRYDVVVLDRDLPGVHGDQICADLVALRRADPGADARPPAAPSPTGWRGCSSAPTTTCPSRSPSTSWSPGCRRWAAGPPRPRRRCSTVGDLVLDPARRVGHPRPAQPLDLTRKEFGVLEELLKARGAVVSSEELLERVWDANTDPFTTTVRVTMMTLRKKLGDPPLIETVVGAGYRVPTGAVGPAHDASTTPARDRAGLPPDPAAAARRCSTACCWSGPGAILVLLAWLLVGDALRPADELRPGTDRAAGRRRGRWTRRQWQTSWSTPPPGAAGQGPGRAAGRSAWSGWPARTSWPAGRCARCSRSPRPRGGCPARHAGPAHPLRRRGRRGGRAGRDVRRDAGPDRRGVRGQKRFVANASHELRTPLAVMRTEVDVTLADPEADVAEFRRMASVVRDASERANALVESLLVLARTEAQAGRRLARQGAGRPGHRGDRRALSAMGREIERLGLRGRRPT